MLLVRFFYFMNISKIKNHIKRGLTFVYHPFIFMTKGRNNNLIVGKKIRINTLKYLHVGSSVTICSDARFLFVDNYGGAEYFPKVSIGNNVFAAYHLTIMAAAPITIEDNVLIASDVVITSENHGLDPESSDTYASTPLVGKPIFIGEGCWIGEKAIILPGVTLGKKCIVAAGAVVTKPFSSYSMIGGVPARLIKKYNLSTHKWEKC